MAAFPLIGPEGIFGTLVLFSDRTDFFNTQKVDQTRLFTYLAAATLMNARLFGELEERFLLTEALARIDKAIAASTELAITFQILLDELVHRLGVDACDIFVMDPHMLTLELVASRGFRTSLTGSYSLKLGESFAGEVALQRRMLRLSDLEEKLKQEFCVQRDLMKKEGFQSYVGVPLIAKGQLLGVLEVFSRTNSDRDDEWFDSLRLFAQRAAVAIDNARLFEDLQRTNAELVRAYDEAIEGWAYVLDLRDRETEGHSRRVAQLTIMIAKEMGIEGEQLVYMRRGALLHDIGKIAIPDRILLKPDKLTDEEWEIMKKHPEYAYQILSRISYLRPAIDIPYCHHEKFDGTGYPRGLKGEEIPLAARIFAVADVFDALTSDRPYRKAWPKEEAIEYIKSQSGKHFDPRVVEVFLELVKEGKI